MFNAFRGTISTLPFHRLWMAGTVAAVLALALWMALTLRIPGAQAAVLAELTASNDGPTELGDSTNFTATITGGSASAYAWDFGDGSSGTGITTSHTYTESGIYTATVVATTMTNSLSATTTVFVGDAVVDVVNNRFSPRDVTIPVGGNVVWVLQEGFHSVTADDGSFDQPAGNDWPPFIHPFDSVGITLYHCTVHGASGGVGMSGSVIVTDEGDEFTGMLLPDIRKNLIAARSSQR